MKKCLSAILVIILLLLCFSGCRIKPVTSPTPPALQAEMLARRFYSAPTPEKMHISDIFSPTLKGQNTFLYVYNTFQNERDRYTFYETDTATAQTSAGYYLEYDCELTANYPSLAALSTDGSILWLADFYEGDVMYGGTNPDRHVLRVIDPSSGTCSYEWDLTALLDIRFSSSLVVAGDTAYVLMEYDTFAYGIACFDATNGTASEMYKFEGIDTEPTLITLSDGRVAAVDAKSRTVIPFAVGTVTPEATLTPAADVTPEVYFSGGEGGQFYYVANDALYGDGTEPLLHFTAQGVNIATADIADIRIQGGVYSILLQENDGLGLYTLSPCTAEEAPQPLTVVGYQVSSGIHAAVKAYNRTYFDHTAMVEDYKQYNDDPNAIHTIDSLQAGITKLNTELLAGKEFDVLVLNEYVSAAALTRQGALLDLYPLMDADSEVTRDTFLLTVLEKTEQDGHLYHLSTAFAIDTLLTNPAVVGDLPSVNIAKWNALAAEHPTSCISDLIEENLLRHVIRIIPYEFLSADRASCSFDSPTFIEYLKTIEKQYNSDESMASFMSGQKKNADRSTLLDGSFLTLDYRLQNLRLYQELLAQFGENLQFTGYLCENGAGHQMEFANTMGILSTSQNVTGAWEFLKLAIMENTLGMGESEDEFHGFPCDRASFEAQLAYYRDPANFVDESGNPLTTPDGYPLAAFSEKDVALLYTLIEEAYPVVEADRTLAEIIYTEAGYYFRGECTAEEAAARIQERAQVYLSEQQ